MTVMRCWAHDLGGCEGGISGEHYISKCLADGEIMRIRGLPFCDDEYREIPWASATVNALCRRHNSILSPIDQAAKVFKNAIAEVEDLEHPTHGDGLWRGPSLVRVQGTALGQWIAKCWCNQLAASNRPIPGEFVRFAFGMTSPSDVHVLIAPQIGRPLHLEWGHFAFLELKHDEPGVTLLAEFYGITWIVTTSDLKGRGRDILVGNERTIQQNKLLERPNQIEVKVPLPRGEQATAVAIVFDWPDPAPLIADS